MTNLLRTGSAWLQAQQKQHASETVSYRRGAASVALAATIGMTEREVDDGRGFPVRTEIRDYLIDTADLVLGGVPTLPERGDRIVETAGATEIVYEGIACASDRAGPHREA